MIKDSKVSVIMAVYNGEKYLKSAIESILNQTIRNFEFILIDDGSKDGSVEILKEFSKKDKRIKILRNSTNIGLTKSLNRAIKFSKGEYIARMDVDDISLSERLELQLKFLNENPDYAFCGCNGIIKQNGQKLLKYFEIDEIRKNLIIENCFAHPTIIIRKKIFQMYGTYNEKYLYGQDYELWCRLIFKHGLLAKNLMNELVIMNLPNERLLEKDKFKVLQQFRNDIITRLRYLRYAENKLRGLFSTLRFLIRIFYIMFLNPISKIKESI